jgi:hypothetical protein
MRCVIDEVLWIGNAADGRNVPKLFELGFNVVVDLAVDEAPAILPRELIYLRFPIHDGIGNDLSVLAVAIRTVALVLSTEGLKILVCCSAGLSRSPAIVAAAVANSTNQTPGEALSLMMSRTTCDVSPGLWSEITNVSLSITPP